MKGLNGWAFPKSNEQELSNLVSSWVNGFDQLKWTLNGPPFCPLSSLSFSGARFTTSGWSRRDPASILSSPATTTFWWWRPASPLFRVADKSSVEEWNSSGIQESVNGDWGSHEAATLSSTHLPISSVADLFLMTEAPPNGDMQVSRTIGYYAKGKRFKRRRMAVGGLLWLEKWQQASSVFLISSPAPQYCHRLAMAGVVGQCHEITQNHC